MQRFGTLANRDAVNVPHVWMEFERMQNSGQGSSPVDNRTYNLLQMLVSKLEAIEAYDIYMEDLEGQEQQLVQRLQDQDRQAAMELVRALGLRTGGGS